MSTDRCSICKRPGEISSGDVWFCEACAHAEGIEQCALCDAFAYADKMCHPEDGEDAPLCQSCYNETEHGLTTGDWSHVEDEETDE